MQRILFVIKLRKRESIEGKEDYSQKNDNANGEEVINNGECESIRLGYAKE